MKWDEIWKIVLGIITSVGGIGGIILVIIKFSSNIIAMRLEEKYTLKLNKELERYKSSLDNKIYISKTKFDAEFNIYRELSKSFFEMIKNINSMIPSGYYKQIANKEKQKEYENDCYKCALKMVVFAQDILNSNAPFISDDIFKRHEEILNLCKVQLNVFEDRWDVLYVASQEEKETFSTDDYIRTGEIINKFKALNTSVREYLLKLDVLE